MPVGEIFDLDSPEGRARFADRYMTELASKRVEAVALADHNTGEWIDVMVAAGRRHGVAVFPGCEITTGSGADGIHLIIIGGLQKTSQDFDRLLHGELGFDTDHPPYNTEGGTRVPGHSRKTVTEILDDLPDDFLAIAPHALGENGIASGNTAKGQIRWRALHHPRLCAVDPGDCSGPPGESFNDRFRHRELADFPRLQVLPFVATSDAYGLDQLGRRFTWIRMEEPSLEALRQAFLDPDARIICNWDDRLAAYPNADPNQIRHAWIESVRIGGRIGNSNAPLHIVFEAGLNVLIGGRGSGKSTVIGAIRHLYSGFATLPDRIRAEAEQFSDAVFGEASIAGTHRHANSQDSEEARWTSARGAWTTGGAGPDVATGFRVRVVNQKELFERVSRDPADPLSASRSFLAFVDESLGLLRTDPPRPGTWWRRFEEARDEWIAATQDLQKLKDDVGQLPSVQAEIAVLQGQVAAFDSDEARARRERNDALLDQDRLLREAETRLLAGVQRVADLGEELEEDATLTRRVEGGPPVEVLDGLERVRREMGTRLRGLAEEAMAGISTWRHDLDGGAWAASVSAATTDAESYLQELGAQGVDPTVYGDLKRRLGEQQALERSLREERMRLALAEERASETWSNVVMLLRERRATRTRLLEDVSARSGRLRFTLRDHGDTIGWTRRVRSLLGLRADGYLEDVPELANWLWGRDETHVRERRWTAWREALVTGDLSSLGDGIGLRSTWQDRLESLDNAVRLLLAAEIPDDVVNMSFLRDGGSSEDPVDWQEITQGSPGQRTAAMLGFVLHHGDEPLVLDQPEDDLDTEWISALVVRELRACRWTRQVIVATHNANIPVNGDAERVIVLENEAGALRVRVTPDPNSSSGQFIQHQGAIEKKVVREDIQNIMEGGIAAFVQRERKYNNEVSVYKTP